MTDDTTTGGPQAPCDPPCGGYADYAAVPCPNPACTAEPGTDHLAEAAKTLGAVDEGNDVSARTAMLEAQAHALIAIAERLDAQHDTITQAVAALTDVITKATAQLLAVVGPALAAVAAPAEPLRMNFPESTPRAAGLPKCRARRTLNGAGTGCVRAAHGGHIPHMNAWGGQWSDSDEGARYLAQSAQEWSAEDRADAKGRAEALTELLWSGIGPSFPGDPGYEAAEAARIRPEGAVTAPADTRGTPEGPNAAETLSGGDETAYEHPQRHVLEDPQPAVVGNIGDLGPLVEHVEVAERCAEHCLWASNASAPAPCVLPADPPHTRHETALGTRWSA